MFYSSKNSLTNLRIFAKILPLVLDRYDSIFAVPLLPVEALAIMRKFIFYLVLILSLQLTYIFAQTVYVFPASKGVIEDVVSDEIVQPDFAPKIVNRPIVQYNDAALEKRVSGRVVLKITLGADAKVSNIEVIEKLPSGLTEKAIDAAQKLKFEPAIKGGKPISMRVKLTFKFICSYKPLSSKDIKGILADEHPWLSSKSQIFLANYLQRIDHLSYYDIIRFAPELTKKGKNYLAPSEQEEYQQLLAKITQLLRPEEQSVLQKFPFFSGEEIAAEDRQKSNAALRKGWNKLSDTDQKRWRELHDKVVEFGLFPPRKK